MKKTVTAPKKLALTKINITVLSPDFSSRVKGGNQTDTVVCNTTGASFIDDCITLKPPTYTTYTGG